MKRAKIEFPKLIFNALTLGTNVVAAWQKHETYAKVDFEPSRLTKALQRHYLVTTPLTTTTHHLHLLFFFFFFFFLFYFFSSPKNLVARFPGEVTHALLLCI